jgi:hypothetical protein
MLKEQGALLNVTLTPGNTVRVACAKHLDRKPVPDLLKNLFGKVFAD